MQSHSAQGELPAPSSADELLRNVKGRAGEDIPMLHKFPAGRLLLRLKTVLPSRVWAPHVISQGGNTQQEADGNGSC